MADNQFQRPQGEKNQSERPMRDRGCTTGVTDTYGADLTGGATNTISGNPFGEFMIPGRPGGGCNDVGC